MRKLLANYSVVRSNPVFLRFWLGSMSSRIGGAVTAVALAWLVLDIAGPRELGVVWLCYGLPRLFSGPVAGRLMDLFQPRVLLVVDNLTRAALVAAIPVFHYLGHLSLAHIYGMAVLSALLSPLTEIAELSLIPRLVDDSELESANALLSVNWEVAYVVGPLFSGALIGVASAPAALLLDSLSFLAMAAIAVTLPRFKTGYASADASKQIRGFKDRQGLIGLLKNRPLLLLSSVTVGFVMVGGMVEVIYPVYIRDGLNAGPGTYGVFVASAAVGALCGALLGFTVLRRLPASVRLSIALLGAAPFYLALTVVDIEWLACGLVAVASLLTGPYYAIERTLAQRLAPAEMRGSIFGMRLAVTSVAFPVGSALVGLLLTFTKPSSSMIVIALAYSLLGLLLLSRPLVHASAADERKVRAASVGA